MSKILTRVTIESRDIMNLTGKRRTWACAEIKRLRKKLNKTENEKVTAMEYSKDSGIPLEVVLKYLT